MNRSRNRVVTDQEADESIKPIEAMEVSIAGEFASGIAMGGASVEAAKSSSPWPRDMTDSEIRLVKAIVANPLKPSSSYPKIAGISPNTFQKIKPQLIGRGLICERKLDRGGRGRSSILLEPLPAAIELVAADSKGGDPATGDKP